MNLEPKNLNNYTASTLINMCKAELKNKYKAVVIGASNGGFNALRTIFSYFPADFKQSVIVVLHLSPKSDGVSRIFRRWFRMIIKEAEEKEEIKGGVVYIAPPNYHLMLGKDKTFILSAAERVNYARPSIDVLFKSVADVYGTNLVGIVLTGGNKDGSQGLKKIKELGGLTIVQDPITAEDDSMPRAAIAVSEIDYVLTLDGIGLLLADLFKQQQF